MHDNQSNLPGVILATVTSLILKVVVPNWVYDWGHTIAAAFVAGAVGYLGSYTMKIIIRSRSTKKE